MRGAMCLIAGHERLRIHEHFATLADPRVDRTKRHALMDIVVIAIVAVIGGADGWDDIELFGDARCEWLKTFLKLRSGVPCADTFRRVFAALDPEPFQCCLLGWMSELADGLCGKLVAMDGKTARGSFGSGHGPLHLVSAWVAENSRPSPRTRGRERRRPRGRLPTRPPRRGHNAGDCFGLRLRAPPPR